MSKCKWCDAGDVPHVLDEDGVLSSLSGKPGVLSHSYDVYWWRCRNAPRKKRSGGQRSANKQSVPAGEARIWG